MTSTARDCAVSPRKRLFAADAVAGRVAARIAAASGSGRSRGVALPGIRQISEDDLADRLARLERGVGGGGLGEREAS